MGMFILASPDNAVIEGQTVHRPSHISVMQWLDLWDRIQEVISDPDNTDPAYRRGFEDGYAEGLEDASENDFHH